VRSDETSDGSHTGMDTGLRVTHIDGHQHMHVLPTVLPIVIEQAKSFGIHAIRIPDESTGFMNYMYSPIRYHAPKILGCSHTIISYDWSRISRNR